MLDYQLPLGILIAHIVRDPRKNIHRILAKFSKVDKFMRRLIEVSETFQIQRESGLPTQDIHMCVLRTDFMIDWPQRSVKLVEYNTIASGMMSLSSKASQIHDYLLDKYAETNLESSYINVKDGEKFSHFIEKDQDRDRIMSTNFPHFDYVNR